MTDTLIPTPLAFLRDLRDVLEVAIEDGVDFPSWPDDRLERLLDRMHAHLAVDRPIDTVTLPRAVVELCVQAARGMVNAAEKIVPDTVGRALDQSHTVRQFKELESALLAALETHHA